MRALRQLLDNLHPLFAKGGRLEKLHAVYEMVDTLFYSPADRTRVAPHVRDGVDLKRVMYAVVIAATPAAIFGIWNVGYQANLAISGLGLAAPDDWRGAILAMLHVAYDPRSLWDCMWHGMAYFLPIYVVTLMAGGFWEVLFAAVRNHEVNEGFLVTSLLFALILPPAIPLWQVALGCSFGVVMGKEVFGGTGKNFLNPALTGRAFLFFAYPAQISGDAVWTAVDGFSGATPLAVAATGGMAAIHGGDVSWMQAFLGTIQGDLGSTSALACIFGGLLLIFMRIASWRIILGVFGGMVITSLLFNFFGTEYTPMASMPWYWHLVVGGFAFGMMFMATDPVSAAMSNTGRLIYGALIGMLTVVIRVANPAFPEGIMLAILFANLVAPLIDYGVVKANIRRRRRREELA
ncbi:MAG: NADH:ubiquinone reductase (Na(+)-transporting) subunit B [Gammaproteobacteria bacterium]|jgi:Na+-transporting NADH:ubiquinone oxidoreductase subunit B|nr:NADH:ubiquinone reductase (Na(+)-transporting) subunit B [Gammaproteobacteria bacterium]